MKPSEESGSLRSLSVRLIGCCRLPSAWLLSASVCRRLVRQVERCLGFLSGCGDGLTGGEGHETSRGEILRKWKICCAVHTV